jgi:hypothetical protein
MAAIARCSRVPRRLRASEIVRYPFRWTSPNLRCGLVGPEPNLNRLSQEPVVRPGQIGDLPDELRLDPMGAGQNERRAEARLPRWRGAQRRVRTRRGLKTAAQVRKHLVGHSCSDPARIDQLAVVIVAEQERAQMRARAFRVGPADDNELLTMPVVNLARRAAARREAIEPRSRARIRARELCEY